MISWGKIAWSAMFVLTTGYLVWFEWTTGDREVSIVLGYLLLFLTFPSGLLLTVCMAIVASAFISSQPPGWEVPHRVAFSLFQCIRFYWVGYVQWFIAVPRWLRSLRGSEEGPEGFPSKDPGDAKS